MRAARGSRLAVGQHAHPALSGGDIEVHSVLHGEFDHVGAGQADGLFRRIDPAVRWLRCVRRAAGPYWDFEHLALSFACARRALMRVWNCALSAMPVAS